MKLTRGLTKQRNICTSQQVFPIYMQPKQNMLILGKDDNASENFGSHEDEKSILEEQDIERDNINLVNKSSDIGTCVRNGLFRCTPQDRLLISKSSSSLREARFNEQEFPADKPILDIKYYHPSSQNDNLFHLFND